MRSISHSSGSANWGQGLPVGSLLLAATLWGVFWYPLRLLEDQGLDGLWATLLIYSGTLIAIVVMSRGHWGEFRRKPWVLLFMALSSGWCNTAFILAMLDGHVMRVLLLFYLSPLWATLIAWLFLREQLDRAAVMVLIVALIGAIIMFWRPELGYPWPYDRADWLALSSGMTFALVNVFIRHAETVSVQIKTTTSWLGVMLVASLLIVGGGVAVPTVSVGVIGAAWLLGAIVMVIMTLSVVYGVTHLPVHKSSIILLFELVAGAISSELLTDEVVRPHEWIGGMMVVLAAYFSARSHLNEQPGVG